MGEIRDGEGTENERRGQTGRIYGEGGVRETWKQERSEREEREGFAVHSCDNG